MSRKWRKGSRDGDEAGSPHDSGGRIAPAPPTGTVARDWICGALLVLAVFISYAGVRNAGFIWDDDAFLTNNPLIKASDGLRRFWFSGEPVDYWPVTSSTLWLEWRLWGHNPLGYHVTNVILHAAETVLIWRILRRLHIPGAFLAAAIFAVHPVNVESVAWITQRKNLVAMLFYLLSILFFINAEDSPQAGGRRAWYGSSLAAFVLAMLGKGSVAMLPLVLLGIVAWRRPLRRGDLIRTIPFLTAAAALTIVNLRFTVHAANGVARHAGFAERLLGAAAAVWFYLYNALLPIHLSYVYPMWNIRVSDPLWWLPLAAAVCLTAVLWRARKGWGRGPLFAWGYFCVSLVPVMGFTDVYFMRYSLVSDHYEHLALIGAIAPLAAAFAVWRRTTSGILRLAADSEVLVVLAGLGLLTSLQCATYKDVETLWRTTIARSPASWMAYNDLAIYLMQKGRVEEAEAICRKALEMDPSHPETRVTLGNALHAQGKNGEAEVEYRRAVDSDPGSAVAHADLGNILLGAGRVDEAIAQYRRALEIQGNFAHAHFNLANALRAKGINGEAETEYRRAIEEDPNAAAAHANLGNILLGNGRIEEAIAQYRRALEISPGLADIRHNLDVALSRQAGKAQPGGR